MEIVVKNIINIFTIIDGKINLLMKNDNLIEINCFDELDIVNDNYIKSNINIKDLDLNQCYTFSSKHKDKLELSILYIDVVNINNVKLNDDYNFVELESLDKNNIIINKSIKYLKKKLILNSTIKKLYPNEFALPEIQKLFEVLLDKKYDRRNFRKRLIKLNVIEDIDKISSVSTGRPAKLYRFKEINGDKELF